MRPYPAKITPPRIARAVPRERLFARLDSLSGSPVAWISSPAGAGKTTLVKSYLEARGLPALWYRVDETDHDAAGFFYYMGEAAKRLRKGRKKHLPLFTPEFRPGLKAFTHHYFESLFRKMPAPGVLVFDNYQDVAADSEFHEIILEGIRSVPDGIRIIIASRDEIPAPLVSLRVERQLSAVGWDEVKFTLEEVREMLAQRGLPEDAVQRAYEETQGWAAALVLMMDEERIPAVSSASVGQSSVFNYFAVEVFRKLDDRIRDFLWITALLPSIPPDTAARLTDMPESGSVLTWLSRNHYFTERHGEEYVYHPLFREFLLEQGKKSQPPERLSALRVQAAHLLAGSGKAEEAVRLLLDAGAHADALHLIISQAQRLHSQGRSATLEEWAAGLPGELKDNSPWLLYWQGMGRLVADPPGARDLLEKAFSLCEAQNDRAGCLVSAAGIVNSITFAGDDHHSLDRWISWIDENLDIDHILSPVEVEAHVASSMLSMFCTLIWRQPSHPHIALWVARAREKSERVQDPLIRRTRRTAKGNVLDYYGHGEAAELDRIGESGQAAQSPPASPIVSLTYLARIWYLYRYGGFSEEGLAVARTMMQLAEETGVYYHLGPLYIPAVLCAFAGGNDALRSEFFARMERFADPDKGAFTSGLLNLRALHHLAAGRLKEALRDAEESVRAADEAGLLYGQALFNLVCFYVLQRMGRREDAQERLRRVEEIISPFGPHFYYLLRLTQAGLFFAEGRIGEGREALRAAFGTARQEVLEPHVLNLWHWQPDELARLCAQALEAGIEADFVKEIIRRHRLEPRGRPEETKDWPWPFRIHTLGRFEILAGDGCPGMPVSIQKKPMIFLRTLIALGGKDVPEKAVEDILWPEAEGDVAHIAFKTTLSRLRKSFRRDAFDVKDGRVHVNPRCVWLDLWAIESLSDRIAELHRLPRGSRPPEGVELLSRSILDIYRGDFLASHDEPHIRTTRERIRGRFERAVKRCAQMLTEAGKPEKAASLRECLRQ